MCTPAARTKRVKFALLWRSKPAYPPPTFHTFFFGKSEVKMVAQRIPIYLHKLPTISSFLAFSSLPKPKSSLLARVPNTERVNRVTETLSEPVRVLLKQSRVLDSLVPDPTLNLLIYRITELPSRLGAKGIQVIVPHVVVVVVDVVDNLTGGN